MVDTTVRDSSCCYHINTVNTYIHIYILKLLLLMYVASLSRNVGPLSGDVSGGRRYFLSARPSGSPGKMYISIYVCMFLCMYVCMQRCSTPMYVLIGTQFRAAGEEDGLELPTYPTDYLR